MLEQTNNAIWQISNPAEWPKAPKWMSFSTLYELEACPRRWSLNTAEYPTICDQQRYPNLPRLHTFRWHRGP